MKNLFPRRTLGLTALLASLLLPARPLQAQTPSWQWAVSPGMGWTQAAAVDGAGNVYVVGVFVDSLVFGATTLRNHSGHQTTFVAKLTREGQPQWATSVVNSPGGGSNGVGLAVDAAGSAYVTGSFFAHTVTLGATQLVNADPANNSTDMFVAKLSPAGAWQWAVGAGGVLGEGGTALALGPQGQVYVTGAFRSPTATFGPAVLTQSGDESVYVARLTAAGVWEWVTAAPGAYPAGATGLGADAGGNVYVGGYFYAQSGGFGATHLQSNGGTDAFVAKLDHAGAWQWAVSAGGAGNEQAGALVVDPAGMVGVSGTYTSPAVTFGGSTVTGGALPGAATKDAFVAKLSPAGAWQWATGVDVNMPDHFWEPGMAVDGSGSFYLTGQFSSPVVAFGSTMLARTCTPAAPVVRDLYVAKLSPAGVWQWATGTDGTCNTVATGVAVDATDNVYVTGIFGDPAAAFGATVLPNPDPFNGYFAPIFVARLAQQLPVTLTTFAPATGGPGSAVRLTGSGFTGATAVRFGGTPATSFTVDSDTQITATVPAGATSGQVHVVTPGGTASGARFTVTTGPTGVATAGAGPPRLESAPNPAHGLVAVRLLDWPAGAAPAPVELFDGVGRRLRLARFAARGAGEPTLALPLDGLPAGLYTIRCGAMTQRLLVE